MEASTILWKDPVLKPSAIFWLFDSDADEWRFVVASADARTRGPQAAYLRIRNLLKHAGLLDKLPLRRVVVIDPANPMLATMQGCIATPGDALASAGVYDCVFNGMHVDGMHVYHFPNDPGIAAGAPDETNLERAAQK
jgi:hypothetical protein